MKRISLTVCLGLFLSQFSHAIDAQDASPHVAEQCVASGCSQDMAARVTPHRVGDATRDLLKLQASGQQASARPFVMSSAVAHKVYERYVNSFSHPIPEQSASTIGKRSK